MDIKKSRRVLIIAEQYYPLMVPGAFRVASFARYFPEFGFEPLLLAPSWNERNSEFACHGGRMAYVEGSGSYSPCTIYQYLIAERRESAIERYWNRIYKGKFDRLNDASSAQKVGFNLYDNHPYCAIIASGPPHFVWHAANSLSKKLQIPWVADVRDVSGQITTYHHGSSIIRFAKKMLLADRYLMRLERRLLNSAAFVTTVSEPLRKLLRSRGVINPHVVLNGFDEEDYQQKPVVSDKFRILHAGTIHPYQDPTIVFNAIDEIFDENPVLAEDFELCFYGNVDQTNQLLAGHPCRDVAMCYPVIAKKNLIPIMMGASVLLHLSTPGVKGILTSKLTEYLGAGRPIITVPGDGDVVDNFVKETGSGISGATVEDVKSFLFEQWQLWKQGISSQYMPCADDKYQYTRRAQCAELSSLLTAIC